MCNYDFFQWETWKQKRFDFFLNQYFKASKLLQFLCVILLTFPARGSRTVLQNPTLKCGKFFQFVFILWLLLSVRRMLLSKRQILNTRIGSFADKLPFAARLCSYRPWAEGQGDAFKEDMRKKIHLNAEEHSASKYLTAAPASWVS